MLLMIFGYPLLNFDASVPSSALAVEVEMGYFLAFLDFIMTLCATYSALTSHFIAFRVPHRGQYDSYVFPPLDPFDNPFSTNIY